MKYIKLFESFQSDEEIHKICNRYGIEDYTINNGVVDVDGDVFLNNSVLYELPLKFGKVTVSFFCDSNGLTSLEGCPSSVGGSFFCDNNELTSLKGCPSSVSRVFDCSYNRIYSFEFIPKNIDELNCEYNPIYNIWELFEDLNQLEYFIDCDPIREPDEEDGLPIVILQRLNHFLEEIGREPVTEVEGYKCI